MSIAYNINENLSVSLTETEDTYDGQVDSATAIADVTKNDNMSQNSSKTDLSDVGLCSLNIHEFSFNIVLSMILAKDYA